MSSYYNVCVCIACSTDIRRGMQNAKEQAYRSNVVFLHVQRMTK